MTPSPRVTPEPAADGTYLALGDSLAVGVGAADPATGGYVARIATEIEERHGGTLAGRQLENVTNLAVSGETSASMRDGGQLDRALETIAGADPPIVLVTLDIGGNDLLALIRAEPCASNPDGEPCREQVRQTLDRFEGNYRLTVASLVEALERQEHGAPLLVMTYFNPFSGTEHAYEEAGNLALLGTDGQIDCDAVEASPQARGMNDIIACLGDELGAVTVDVGPRFAGRGIELTHIAEEDIHTNDDGHAAIADGFIERLVELGLLVSG